MTTLLLSHDFPPLGGGIARWMTELAFRYPAGTLVVSTGSPAVPDLDRTCPNRIDRLEVPLGRLKTLPNLIRWSGRAASLASEHQADFIWCDTVRPAAYPGAWLARQGLPTGLFAHGSDLLQLEAKVDRSPIWKRAVIRRLLAAPRVIVANSRWTAAAARDLIDRLDLPRAPEVVVVPLGSDPTIFRPGVACTAARARYGMESGRWLLVVARLVPHKGIDLAIEALSRLRGRFPDLGLAVVGSGPDRERLDRLAQSLGAAVRFLGSVPAVDLPALYQTATAVLGLSRQEGQDVEGFGIAVADAMASGRPVVVGASGGLPETVEHEVTGLVVPPTEPDAVAEAIGRLLDQPDYAAGLAGAARRRVEERLNWDRVVRDLIELAHQTSRR